MKEKERLEKYVLEKWKHYCDKASEYHTLIGIERKRNCPCTFCVIARDYGNLFDMLIEEEVV